MSDTLPRLMLSADTALVVVTTVAEGERSGCVVAFHSQASSEPERYAVWLSKANHTYRVALRAEHFVVHFLRDTDVGLARHFGTQSEDDVDKFEEVAWTPGPGGVPLLDDLPRRITLRRMTIVDDGGNHVCVSGEVLQVHGDGDFKPLRFSAAADWDPGHESDERAVDPAD